MHSFLLVTASAVLAASAGTLPELEKRQAPPLFASGGETTLAQRATFLCPAGIDGALPLNTTHEFGLRFCSNVDRWSPNDLFSSQPLLNVGSRNYRGAAAQCAPRCASFPQCETFSITSIGTPTNSSFNCNLYNRTTIFRGNTTGGLFYARQRNQTIPQPSTVTQVRTTCPVAPTTNAGVAPGLSTIRNPTATLTQFPVVVVIQSRTVTVTAATQTITRTTTIGNAGAAPTVIQSAAPINVFIGQTGPIQVTQIVNNIVTVIVVIVNGDLSRPTTTSTVQAAPSATNSFTRPANSVTEFQSVRRPAFAFILSFASNVQRWSADRLTSSTPIADSTYAAAARECSARCDQAANCQAFSVAPTTAGGSTFNCNQYDVAQVANGNTNGGLFYARTENRASQAGGNPQCLGAVTPVNSGTTTFFREFCAQNSRYSPAVLISGTVVTGSREGSAEPIVGAVRTCAANCANALPQNTCRTFSVTYTDGPNVVAAIDGIPQPINFNCNLYRNDPATGDVPTINAQTNGGAFYRRLIASNATMTAR
ncbi:hypothetical protein PYCC9005_004108 [Savitreella phatthalungensis]